jgi:hypothetical protein
MSLSLAHGMQPELSKEGELRKRIIHMSIE